MEKREIKQLCRDEFVGGVSFVCLSCGQFELLHRVAGLEVEAFVELSDV
jgi:hypothetical protein